MKRSTNLYKSEVYRELERRAVKKGFFEPTDEEKINIAAQKVESARKINAPVDTSITNDLTLDIAKLALAMRRKGFIALAEDVEQKLMLYKVAESGLYNVTVEKNKDFIEMAHRDGDVDIVGAGELGTVETIQSIADKILAVTRKQPTGKLGELAKGILRQAQLPVDIGGEEGGEKKVPPGLVSKMSESNTQLNQIVAVLAGMKDLNFNDAMNTFLHGDENRSSLFINLGGNYQILDTYGRMVKNAYRGGQRNVQTIAENIVRGGQGYLSSIGNYSLQSTASVTDQNVKRAQPVFPNAGMAAGVAQSVIHSTQQKQIEDRKQQAGPLAQKIHTDIERARIAANTEVQKVNGALGKYIGMASKLAGLITALTKYPQRTPEDALNYAKALKGAVPQISAQLAQPIVILQGFGKQAEVDALRTQTSLLEQLSAIMEPEAAQIVGKINEIDPTSTLGRLRSVNNQINENGLGDKHKGTKDAISKMYAIIKQRENGGEKYLLEGLKEFGNYKSWSDVDRDTIELEKVIQADIAKAKGSK